MAITKEDYAKIEEAINNYEKLPVTREKIGKIRKLTKEAREEEWTSKDKGEGIAIRYEGKEAYVRNRALGLEGSTKVTAKKCVIADDYLGQGRNEEAYAILGNAFQKFDRGGGSITEENEAVKTYEAIERRAFKGAKKVMKKDLKLAKDFIKLAKGAKFAYEKSHLRV